jgi:hypothetical protein
MANGQDSIYTGDECRCDDPVGLYWCRVHEHYANHDLNCRGRCYQRDRWASEPEEHEGGGG